MAGGRGDDLAGWARPESKRSAATKRTAGQFVKCASESDGGRVPATAVRERAIPGHGKGGLRHSAGAAGLTVLREGWKPGRVETRSAATGLDAQHDSLTPLAGDAHSVGSGGRALR